jgi:hypothetical protein
LSKRAVFAVACCALAACGGNGSGDELAQAGTGHGAVSSGGGAGPGEGATASGGMGGAGTSGDGSGALSAGGDAFEPIYGRWGEEPQNTFMLPVPTAAAGASPELYHPDLVKDFPDVDFATLDRLYIPAGVYKTILLGKLPERAAERPLVIPTSAAKSKSAAKLPTTCSPSTAAKTGSSPGATTPRRRRATPLSVVTPKASTHTARERTAFSSMTPSARSA